MADVVRKKIDGRRHYTDGNWCYPSVTTVLGILDDGWLDDWKKNVGAHNAERIGRHAAARGTVMHQLCEAKVLGQPEPLVMNPLGYSLYKKLTPSLDKIKNVIASEMFLYGHVIKVAGTVDCIGEFDGVLSIIDFKSALRPKKEEDILGYFLQCAMYGVMFMEMSNIKIEQGVILIANELTNEPQEIVFSLRDYYPKLKEVILMYREVHGTPETN